MKLQCTYIKLRSDYRKLTPQSTNLSTQFFTNKKLSGYKKFLESFKQKKPPCIKHIIDHLLTIYIFAVSDAVYFVRFFYIALTRNVIFINRFKAERFSAFLIRGDSLFHFFGPRTLQLFSSNFFWFALTTFKFKSF